MSVAEIFYLHAIKFGDSGALTQLTDMTPAANLEEITEFSAGHPEPLFTGHGLAAPAKSFTTSQIATLLTLVGSDFVLNTSGSNTDLEYRRGANHGFRASGSVHRSFRATQGMLVLDRIQASQGQQATASARYLPTFDGTNDPLQPLGTVGLAATAQAAEQFTLGPVAINGSPLAGVRDVTVEFNPQTNPEAADGDEYNTYCDVETIMPVITIRGRALSAWGTVALDGLAVTSFAFWLRRRQPSKINYADGSSQHILIAGTTGTAGMVQTTGGGRNKTETELRVRLHSSDSSTASITAATAQAIS